MCGIVGLIDLDGKKPKRFEAIATATKAQSHRGPDHEAHLIDSPVALGHTRLSIIDLEARSNQPMTDINRRYSLVFNGEIYNYKELRQECQQLGYQFKTESDTEVLLVLYIHFGANCLQKLNGCFAFAVYDRSEKTVFLARDRFGIKPLVYFFDGERFAFSSELKALRPLTTKSEIDKVSLFTYFKFNYIPAPNTILHNHYKLEPGHSITVSWKDGGLDMQNEAWYEIPYDPEEEKTQTAHDYKQAQKVLKRFLRESVRRRLVSDVPLGTFLSGGIDSSIITALASQEKDDLSAFSVGFSDQPYYDETKYARQVADHLGIQHHVIDVRSNDLLETADEVLEHLDEPFADSSALNVYLLSKFTRNHVSVALSGDGGDELFGGYNKHGGEYRLRYPTTAEHAIGNLGWLWNRIPASRSGFISNTARQLRKFSDGYALNYRDRYWRWAGILTEEQANFILKEELLERDQRLSDDGHAYKKRKDGLLKFLRKTGTFNEVLLTDMHLVLPNDMLYKVDSMSMAHGLEVRTPLLDQHVVKHAFKLPVMFKVNNRQKKKILIDSYRDILPAQVFDRRKKGFEVPLLEWFRGPMQSQFEALCDDRAFIEEQGLFNYEAIDELKRKLRSSSPGDTPATAWAYVAFQRWYQKNMM